MRNLILFISLFFLMKTPLAMGQSAWTRDAKKLYVQAGFYAITPSRALSLFGFKRQLLHRKISEWSLPVYAEYGIIKKLTVYGQVPLKLAISGQKVFASEGGVVSDSVARPAGTLVGLGNAQLGLRYNIFSNGPSLSLNASVSAPATRVDTLSQLSPGVQAWTFSPLLWLGVSGNKWFLQLASGVHFRTNGYTHQWQGMLEMGYKTKKGAYLGWVIDSRLSINKGADIPYSSNQVIYTGLFVNRQDYLAWLLKASVPFKAESKWGLSVFLGGGLLVNHIQQSPSIGVSVYYKN